MAELSTYWQIRMLVAEALLAANEMDNGAAPEPHAHLHLVRQPLHSALKRLDSNMPDLFWPGRAARA